MFLGKGLVIPAVDFAKVADRFGLFTGFDEVWCFSETPKVMKPADFWIVSPSNIDQEDVPPALIPWMEQSGCRLGLGDGIGLNYATPDKNTAILLEEFIDSDE